MHSFLVLLIPLLEIFVAKEVNRIEDAPALRLEVVELRLLGSEYNSRRGVVLDVRHHVLLSDVDQIVFAYFQSTKP